MSSSTRAGRIRITCLLLSLALFLAGVCLIGNQAWIRAKAVLASILIERAFAAHMEDGGSHPPWSWADTHPIARLSTGDGRISRVVLTGASGGSLAFGPGHVDGTAHPNSSGNCVIAGHRDTWFRFLKDLTPGERLILTSSAGSQSYLVEDISIVNHADTEVLDRTERTQLTLITCYPFDGLLSSEQRYVVVCLPA